MAISFTDLLESLRADGKLIVSTVIKAAAGRKDINQCRRQSKLPGH